MAQKNQQTGGELTRMAEFLGVEFDRARELLNKYERLHVMPDPKTLQEDPQEAMNDRYRLIAKKEGIELPESSRKIP